MNINLLLILLALFGVLRGYVGGKRGFSRELGRLWTVAAGLLALCLLITLIFSFRADHKLTAFLAFLLLVMTGILTHLMKWVMKAVEAIADLPLITLLDHMLGAAAGVLEIAILYWGLMWLGRTIDLGIVGSWMAEQTDANPWLTLLESHNGIQILIAAMSKIA